MVRTRTSAFTLVELLVVVAIIALLVGILLPALARARAQAQEVQCMSNMRQWGMGLQMYVDQNKGQLPQKGPGGTNTSTDSFGPANNILGVNDPSLWFNAIPVFVNQKGYYDMLVYAQGFGTALQNGHPGPPVPLPHAGDNSIYICPTQMPVGSDDLVSAASAAGSGDLLSTDSNYFSLNGPNVSTLTPHGVDSYGVLQNGANKPSTAFYWAGTYVWNSKLTSNVQAAASNSESGNTNPAIKMSSLQPTSEVVVMTEMMTNYGEYKDPSVLGYYNDPRYKTNFPGNGGIQDPLNSAGLYGNNVGQMKACWTRFTTRHNHGGNLLFADGHVAWFAWTDVQIPLDGSTATTFGSTTIWNANQPAKVTWCPLGPTD
jgi:prepilin-type processing-associated H-X9-DG protein/prepilin-type N-terminal cleavage/methylation domain-containing protein